MVIATARQFDEIENRRIDIRDLVEPPAFDEMDDDALALALKCVSWTPRDVQHFLHSHRAR